jgi:hypothetical protein
MVPRTAAHAAYAWVFLCNSVSSVQHAAHRFRAQRALSSCLTSAKQASADSSTAGSATIEHAGARRLVRNVSAHARNPGLGPCKSLCRRRWAAQRYCHAAARSLQLPNDTLTLLQAAMPPCAQQLYSTTTDSQSARLPLSRDHRQLKVRLDLPASGSAGGACTVSDQGKHAEQPAQRPDDSADEPRGWAPGIRSRAAAAGAQPGPEALNNLSTSEVVALMQSTASAKRRSAATSRNSDEEYSRYRRLGGHLHLLAEHLVQRPSLAEVSWPSVLHAYSTAKVW